MTTEAASGRDRSTSAGVESARRLLPFPEGWYAVAMDSEIRQGKILSRRFMDREVVVYRAASGRVVVADATCPHLGAHLGGGRVVGDCIECPFHRFVFSPDGQCVDTPYESEPPVGSRMTVLPHAVVAGAVLAYHGPEGRPRWQVLPPDDDHGWGPTVFHRLRLRGHPQETTENSVDYGHFGALHGFEGFRVLSPLDVDGPRLGATYTSDRRYPLGVSFSDHYELAIDGVGFSRVQIRVGRSWEVRQLVLSTPIGDGEVEVTLSAAARRREDCAPSQRAVPPVVFARIALGVVVKEVGRDKTIWERKTYLERPALAQGDGPIMKYRRWARQFYPGPGETGGWAGVAG